MYRERAMVWSGDHLRVIIRTNILLNVIIMAVYLMPFTSVKTSLLDYSCHEVTYLNVLYATLIYHTLNYSLRDLLIYSTLIYTELFYSSVQEAVEVAQEPKNSTLFINHFLCQVYLPICVELNSLFWTMDEVPQAPYWLYSIYAYSTWMIVQNIY